MLGFPSAVTVHNPFYLWETIMSTFIQSQKEESDINTIVARYIFKKQNGKTTQYEICDPETGELYDREREMVRMSLKPGIGANWLQKYKSEVIIHDKVIINGTPMNPPKYYMKKIKETEPEEYENLMFKRGEKAKQYAADNTDERRLVKEEVLKASLKQSTRRDTFK